MPARPLESDDPRRLGEYVLISRLGAGGQGVVYLGRAADTRLVAVKVLRSYADPEARRRLEREVSAARRVPSFYTARVLDWSGMQVERPYVVSEYIDGPSLHDQVSEQGPLTGGTLELAAINTAHALAAIHGAGVVHRDLKPANVLLGRGGPMVVDFGIAREVDAQTHTGRLVGTPAYLTPEQLDNRPATEASDVFAWAGTMVFAATGRSPFGGREDSIELVFRRIVDCRPDLTGVPDSLLGLIRECLVKEPAGRPTARQLIARLTGQAPAPHEPVPWPGERIGRDMTEGAWRTPPPERPPPERPPPDEEQRADPPEGASRSGSRRAPPGAEPGGGHGSRRRPWLVLAAALLILLAVLVGGWVVLGDDDPAADGIPTDFAGTWSGRVLRNTTSGTREGTARITLAQGQATARAEYPEWQCDGLLTLRAASRTELTFDLEITSGTCVSGEVTMTMVNQMIDYLWSAEGDTTSGQLGRN